MLQATFSHVSAPICVLPPCLSIKISASELSRKFVNKSALLVGSCRPTKSHLEPFPSLTDLEVHVPGPSAGLPGPPRPLPQHPRAPRAGGRGHRGEGGQVGGPVHERTENSSVLLYFMHHSPDGSFKLMNL